ncbi:TetR/AcrR family transcriptional regulator [Martelella endophytica]|uniref:TetR family transcriptional regulator n=1 Tax=Martelella endophytica TaxID=1486262 RepID=A0A0D5LN18_MAREN|nr:TetR/AcrR family transcriptional regulator [Martelella endophytica]AJY45167.1 TetR family transcriptional regulator [Martelella endophytica]
MANMTSTADDVLITARKLITEGGYNGFSYADIANVVGIRKASIHHHFPTKAELVRVLVEKYRGETMAGLQALEVEVTSPAGQLRAYLRYWERCIGDASQPFCVAALLGCELPALPSEVAREVSAYFRMLSGWIAGVLERGVGAGELRLQDTAAVEAEAFMATVHGAMLSARAYGDVAIFHAIARTLMVRVETG